MTTLVAVEFTLHPCEPELITRTHVESYTLHATTKQKPTPNSHEPLTLAQPSKSKQECSNLYKSE